MSDEKSNPNPTRDPLVCQTCGEPDGFHLDACTAPRWGDILLVLREVDRYDLADWLCDNINEAALVAHGRAAEARIAEVNQHLADELDRVSVECDETPDTGVGDTSMGALMRRAADAPRG